MDQQWKLLYDFNTFEQAQFAKQTLEENGLRCLVLDEHSSKFVNYFRTHGGVRLFIHTEDFDLAVPIVKKIIDFEKSPSILEWLDQQLPSWFMGDINVVYKLLIFVTFLISLVSFGGYFLTS